MHYNKCFLVFQGGSSMVVVLIHAACERQLDTCNTGLVLFTVTFLASKSQTTDYKHLPKQQRVLAPYRQGNHFAPLPRQTDPAHCWSLIKDPLQQNNWTTWQISNNSTHHCSPQPQLSQEPELSRNVPETQHNGGFKLPAEATVQLSGSHVKQEKPLI